MAGMLFGHEGIESLRRELLRNRELLQVCGFDPLRGIEAVPPAWVYSRFMRRLLRHSELVQRIFDRLVEEVTKELPDFGEYVAADSKAIWTYARGRRKPEESADPEADWGCKTYREEKEDGSVYERIKSWFGYKIHLVVDSVYELPVAFTVTRASANDGPQLGELMKGIERRHPELIERMRYAAMDKGYDSAENNASVCDEYGAVPLIPVRRMWREEEGVGVGCGLRQVWPERSDNILYDETGTVSCMCPSTGTIRQMVFWGYEAKRCSLKYRCPAAAYGIECAGKMECCKGDYGRVVRIPLERDRRIFVALPRHTAKFKREYKRRTAVERVNSRIALQLGFERHFIRGKKKMQLKGAMALSVMLAMALGYIRENQSEKMRCLRAA